jgi:TPP-dependent trihydroxycyclohexane-1,2-dione (THcHDO) dehydratase
MGAPHGPVKSVILKNNTLAEVMFEQKQLDNLVYGCDLSPIDFVGFARACGSEGFHCEKPTELRSALRAAFSSRKSAIVEAVVDAQEKPSNGLETALFAAATGRCSRSRSPGAGASGQRKSTCLCRRLARNRSPETSGA